MAGIPRADQTSIWISKMDIWDVNKIYIFVGFVIPGFITLKTYQVLTASAPQEASKQLIDAVAYSCINYALLFWPIYMVESSGLRHNKIQLYLMFYLLVLLVAPAFWAGLYKAARATGLLQRMLPHPTEQAWDYVFSQRQPCWMIVTLNDGTKIAGKFGNRSFASSTSTSGQIFLEETWLLNDHGGFERPRSETSGTLIVSGDIRLVEMFRMTWGATCEQR